MSTTDEIYEPIPLEVKYSTDQEAIIRHAQSLISLYVFPIMANFSGMYVFANNETKVLIYNSCVDSNDIVDITEYNNFTTRLTIPTEGILETDPTMVYEDLEIIRTISDNALNISELLTKDLVPNLKILELSTINPNELLSIGHRQIEELVITGTLDESSTVHNKIIRENYPALQLLSLTNCTIRLSGDICDILILNKCTCDKGKICTQPERLTIRDCKGDYSALRPIDTFEFVGDDINPRNITDTLSSLSLMKNFYGEIDALPNVKNLALYNLICPIPESVEQLTFSGQGNLKGHANITELNLDMIRSIDIERFTGLQYLSINRSTAVVSVDEILDHCDQLVFLEIVNCALTGIVDADRKSLVIKFYDCLPPVPEIKRLIVNELHCNGANKHHEHIARIVRQKKRVSKFGFSTMDLNSFIKFCVDKCVGKLIENYIDMLDDIMELAEDDPILFHKHYSYFITMRCLFPYPEDDFFFEVVIRYGNPISKLQFDVKGKGKSLISIDDIRNRNGITEEAKMANKRYRTIISELDEEEEED